MDIISLRQMVVVVDWCALLQLQQVLIAASGRMTSRRPTAGHGVSGGQTPSLVGIHSQMGGPEALNVDERAGKGQLQDLQYV